MYRVCIDLYKHEWKFGRTRNAVGTRATGKCFHSFFELMYRVCIDLYKHEWKFGRTRDAVGTQATGECFHSFFKFSQTFTSVCITRYKNRQYMFSISFRKQRDKKKENNLLTMTMKM